MIKPEHEQALLDDSREGFKVGGELAKETLRALILINGGAIVALLTFIGNLRSESLLRVNLEKLGTSLGLFILGLVFAILATIVTWLYYDTTADRTRAIYQLVMPMTGQGETPSPNHLNKAMGFLSLITPILVLGSVITFGAASVNTLNSFDVHLRVSTPVAQAAP